MAHSWPDLRAHNLAGTRDAIHAYSQVLGEVLKQCREPRKHWWHASLRPSLGGLTTGIVRAEVDFELEIDLQSAELRGLTSNGHRLREELAGQPQAALAERVSGYLSDAGVRTSLPTSEFSTGRQDGFVLDQADLLQSAMRHVATVMETIRSRVREETSPVQLWPHHFDLAMLWLPGSKVEGRPVENEEYADQQMNFGFSCGDAEIAEPYFYVTAYPEPPVFVGTELPAGADWHQGSFSGAILRYHRLLEEDDPSSFLLGLWRGLLNVGRRQMLPDYGKDSVT